MLSIKPLYKPLPLVYEICGIESFLPHKLTDQVREKLRVAGRADPAGSEDKADGDSTACPAAVRCSEVRQAA